MELPRGAAAAAIAIMNVISHFVPRGYCFGSSTSANTQNCANNPRRFPLGTFTAAGAADDPAWVDSTSFTLRGGYASSRMVDGLDGVLEGTNDTFLSC